MRTISTLLAGLAAMGISLDAGNRTGSSQGPAVGQDVGLEIARLSAKLNQALPVSSESSATTKTAQWFNFNNCVRGGWRNC